MSSRTSRKTTGDSSRSDTTALSLDTGAPSTWPVCVLSVLLLDERRWGEMEDRHLSSALGAHPRFLGAGDEARHFEANGVPGLLRIPDISQQRLPSNLPLLAEHSPQHSQCETAELSGYLWDPWAMCQAKVCTCFSH